MNKMQGGALKEKWHKKIFQRTHLYSGIVNWPTSPMRARPAQRFQISPLGDSSSCVAQSAAGQAEMWLGKPMSAQPIFSRRTPKGYGMYLSDADSISIATGTNTEALVASQKMTDSQLDVPNSTLTPFKGSGKGTFVPINADSIADAINIAKGVKVTFESNEEEWDSPNQTPVWDGGKTTFGHCIFFFDFYMNKGVKTFIANDSDGLWSSPNGLRYITEAFLVKRATGASYVPTWIDTTLIPVPGFPNMKPESPIWIKWFLYFWNGGI